MATGSLSVALLGAALAGAAYAGDPPGPEIGSDPAAPDQPLEASEAAEAEAPAPPLPLAITVSGAVSLGAWQAGYLYYLSETIKHNRDRLDLRLLTGASAGTINALVMAMEVARNPIANPADSLFWDLWNEFTYDEIFDVAEAEGPFLSSGEELRQLAGKVEGRWQQGLPPGHDVVLAAAVTRLEPRTVDLGGGLTVSRNQEHFVLRIRGSGKRASPQVNNYVDIEANLPQLLLPLEQNSHAPGAEGDFAVLTRLLLASSALPGAFEPQLIHYCETPLEPGVNRCPNGQQTARFIDGAVSDRYPLRLAWRLADQGLREGDDGRLTWLHAPDEDHHGLPEDLLFLYMDPMHTSYPPLPSPGGIADGGSKDKIMATLGGLVGDFAGSAQAAELYNLAEENPDLQSRLALVEPALPPVSGELSRFFGFFDRRFRRYDFFLGMVDAHHFVEEVLQPRVTALGHPAESLVLPEPDEALLFWNPYACIRAVVDGVGDPVEACKDEHYGGIEVLLQSSIDRLWDHCERLPDDTVTDHELCLAAMHSPVSRPLVPNVAVAPDRSWKRRGPQDNLEGEFEYLSRLLEQYQFEYRDFGLPRQRAWLGTTFLREEMGGMVSAYGEKLDGRLRMLVLGAGKPALNVLHYAPPVATVHLSVGSGLEAGFSASGRLAPHRWLRYHMALQVAGLQRFLSSRPNVVNLNLWLLGLEIEVPRLSGVLLQPRLVLRAGYQASTGDRSGSLACDTARFDDDPMVCSVPSAEALLLMPVFERLRLHAGVQYDAGFVLGDDAVRDDAFAAVGGLGFQWLSPFRAVPRHRVTRAWRREDEEQGTERP